MKKKLFRRVMSAFLAALCLAGFVLMGGNARAEEVDPDVQAIIDRGVLRVGVKNAVIGFGFQDTLTGEYSGMEIDLATALAEELGVDVEFTTVTAATRTELLDSGDIDCVLPPLPSPMSGRKAGISPLPTIPIMSPSW